MKVFTRFVKLTYQAHKAYYYVLILSSITSSFQMIFGATILSMLIASMEAKNIEKTLMMTVLLAVVEAFLLLVKKYMDRQLAIHNVKMNQAVKELISQKIMNVSYSYLENPSYMELKKNAEYGVQNMGTIISFCTSIATIVQNVMTLMGLGIIIFTFNPVLIVILMVGILLTALGIKMSMKVQIQFFNDLLPINYRFQYFTDLLINEKKAKDFRFYSTYQLLFNRFNYYSKEISRSFGLVGQKMAVYQTLISTIRYVQMAIVYIFVGLTTISYKLSVSQFSLVVSAAMTFSDSISMILNSSSSFMRAIEYAKPLLELFELEDFEGNGNEKVDHIETIEFKHVDFKYPNTDHLILKDVSFVIHKNEKISIVGLNGAGKTTIVKLLCRLYDPTRGRILVNGKDLRAYHYEEYMKRVSTVFQDYKMFAMSIYENIGEHVEKATVRKLCYQTGIGEAIEQLPYQWDSVMKKSFDEKGIEMSGGQTQKIAITRALAKNSDLLILDEPTSALDPLAEAEIYQNFNNLAENRMAIYISHRMSSSVFCDKILIIENGHVLDFDSHENLLKKTDSLYYKLFMTQAENYTN